MVDSPNRIVLHSVEYRFVVNTISDNIPEFNDNLDRFVKAVLEMGQVTGTVSVSIENQSSLEATLIRGTSYTVDFNKLFVMSLGWIMGLIIPNGLIAMVIDLYVNRNIICKLSEDEAAVFAILADCPENDKGKDRRIPLDEFRNELAEYRTYEEIDAILNGLADKGLIELRTDEIIIRRFR